jgi:hypothetical protein
MEAPTHDTQYTDLDEGELISLGMVSKNLKDEFYAEQIGFSPAACSESLKAQVLPLLGKAPDTQLTDAKLAERLHAWFETILKKITLAENSLVERNLMREALDGKVPSNKFTDYYLRQLSRSRDYHESLRKYHEIEGQTPYHALHAARAKLAGWLAWELSHCRWLE